MAKERRLKLAFPNHKSTSKVMSKLNDLQDLLQYQLGIIFDAENQLIQALPVLKKSAFNINLKKSFRYILMKPKCIRIAC